MFPISSPPFNSYVTGTLLDHSVPPLKMKLKTVYVLWCDKDKTKLQSATHQTCDIGYSM